MVSFCTASTVQLACAAGVSELRRSVIVTKPDQSPPAGPPSSSSPPSSGGQSPANAPLGDMISSGSHCALRFLPDAVSARSVPNGADDGQVQLPWTSCDA